MREFHENTRERQRIDEIDRVTPAAPNGASIVDLPFHTTVVAKELAAKIVETIIVTIFTR